MIPLNVIRSQINYKVLSDDNNLVTRATFLTKSSNYQRANRLPEILALLSQTTLSHSWNFLFRVSETIICSVLGTKTWRQDHIVGIFEYL